MCDSDIRVKREKQQTGALHYGIQDAVCCKHCCWHIFRLWTNICKNYSVPTQKWPHFNCLPLLPKSVILKSVLTYGHSSLLRVQTSLITWDIMRGGKLVRWHVSHILRATYYIRQESADKDGDLSARQLLLCWGCVRTSGWNWGIWRNTWRGQEGCREEELLSRS